MEESTYFTFEYECKYCEYRNTLMLTIDELVDNGGSPAFVGMQCEPFFYHLESHDICRETVGVSTISECLFGVQCDNPQEGNILFMIGGVTLDEHFKLIF